MKKKTGFRFGIGNVFTVHRSLFTLATLLLLAGTAQGGDNYYWKGTTAAWETLGNWTNSSGANPSSAFTSADQIVINSTEGAQPTITLTTAPITVSSLTVGQGATAMTLTFDSGNVTDKKLLVTGDVTIGSNGTLTHAAETSTSTAIDSETQRLFLDVGGNLTITAGGQINVDAKGYTSGKGPGVSYRGGCHGGLGAPIDDGGGRGASGITYGSITNPVNAGSGAGGGGSVRGGGVVVLRVSGAVTHNGVITAVGGTGGQNGGGAGGSINITAGSMAGTTGSIRADGGYDGNFNTGCGGGGRIALWIGSGGIPVSVLANVTAYAGTNSYGSAAAGTVYVHTNATGYGNLIVNNGGRASRNALETTLLRNSTYRFDTITVTNQGVFAVGTNAAITLNGCVLRSDSTTAAIGSRLVVQDNGQLNWTGTWTNNGVISWRGTNRTSGLSVGNLTIAAGGILTQETTERPTNCLTLAVNGDLTVDAGGAIWVRGDGCSSARQPSGIGYSGFDRFGGAHGGEGGSGDDGSPTKAPTTPTFGSVTNPVTAGGAGSCPGHEGGGVVILRVAGTVTVNGVINANGVGPSNGGGGGAGGSINIQAGVLEGGGSILADGSTVGNVNAGGGGGGRIAVVLTNSTSYANVAISAVGGKRYNETDTSASAGAAGTIYLKGANQAYGLLIVSNSVTATVDRSGLTNITTTISPYVTDAVVGDVQLLNTAKLAIATNCTLTVYGSWSNAAAAQSGTNLWGQGTVVLAGTGTISVWGSNTWYNLTIATAGKQVQFQTNVIQYVYGTPAWSNNVQLLPIQNGYVSGTYWKLYKPNWGATQDVGVVTVQWSDALVNTGATFRAAVGSSVSNSRNWVVIPPSGTLIILR